MAIKAVESTSRWVRREDALVPCGVAVQPRAQRHTCVIAAP